MAPITVRDSKAENFFVDDEKKILFTRFAKWVSVVLHVHLLIVEPLPRDSQPTTSRSPPTYTGTDRLLVQITTWNESVIKFEVDEIHKKKNERKNEKKRFYCFRKTCLEYQRWVCQTSGGRQRAEK